MNKPSRIAEVRRLDLIHRPRRNRKAEWSRRLVRENMLTTDDLIWPLFLVEGEKTRAPVAAMPGVERLSVDEAVRDAERAVKLGVPAIAFFPYTEAHLKDERGSEAFNEGNLVCRACRAIKKEFPELGLVTDVALDPYTSHGHDGLMRERRRAHRQRRDRRGAGPTGAQPGARRGRRDRAVRHDGRPRRRDPRGARRRGFSRRADPRLRRQIRLAPSMGRSATRSAPRAR